ncbi:MAG: sigma 54-interacting transcriptional regulator [Phycisphaerales bacterium]|nr:MAG: sigma 54-interacting transcriptional regulator [Phycisphaerales bacterium]
MMSDKLKPDIYAHCVEEMPDAVFLVRSDGAIVLANRQAEVLFGYSRDEMVGQPIELLVPKRFAGRHVDLRSSYFAKPVARPLGAKSELAGVRKDGSEVPVEIGLSALETTDGLIVACTVRDVTLRREDQRRIATALSEVSRLKDLLAAENRYLRSERKRHSPHSEIIGKSEAIKEVLEQIDKVAPTDVTVFLLGETGTGKGLFAEAIHQRSRRRDHPFIDVDCAAIAPSLIESELFGHEKGAFTGATQRRIGHFELASGGTIFLDEVGELAPDVQTKLLRVLEDGSFRRVGSSRVQSTDVRVIAATNRELHRDATEGCFRMDLLYRLASFPIELPPLRRRRDDIPSLAWHFVHGAQVSLRKSIDRIPDGLMKTLVAYDWPGNVRELRSVLERAMILSTGNTLQLPDLAGPDHRNAREEQHKGDALQAIERAHVTQVLETCGWKIKGPNNAADRLGLKPSTLRSRLKKLGIARP